MEKFRGSLTAFTNSLCRLLLSHYLDPGGTTNFLSFLSYNLRKYDLGGTGKLNFDSFYLALKQAMATPGAPNPTIFVPPREVVTDVFSCFKLCSSQSVTRHTGPGFIDMEIFMAVASYWSDYLTNSTEIHKSWQVRRRQVATL